ncbi:CAT RNA binding domain-containing protein [Pectinatus haikarae]|uniref:CAT RNA-binding domain-containing protein n=1 Tax=Pectinatus haikarae TaxID=349096 RepID=A0ABT9Y402_9FIRM|nr:CAT RNA binding domain-containing protein [Pectinatus haikarae]MDQ0202451.1 hypothetical protein [Pectinatus haikarae]
MSARGGAFTYRIIKALNNNSLLALDSDHHEVILIGKGLGFGRKNGERLEDTHDAKIYTLTNDGNNSALQKINSINPIFIEIAVQIISEAEKNSRTSIKIFCCPWPTILPWL